MNSTNLAFDVAVCSTPAVDSPPKPHVSHTQLSSSVAEITPARQWYIRVKPWLDAVAAMAIAVLAVPVILMAALATKLTSSGPCFFRQTRVGLHGREFKVWKIRTMVVDAEANTGPVWSVTGDPRITPLGRFLRATHIDEFPQLFNVLTGDMSLVGPRPERPEFVARLEWRLADYRQRLNVRPGITGLAQMLLPPDSDLESVGLKLRHDLYYVRHMSPLLDLKIFIHTGWDLLRSLGAITLGFLRLPQGDEILEMNFQSDLVASTSSSGIVSR